MREQTVEDGTARAVAGAASVIDGMSSVTQRLTQNQTGSLTKEEEAGLQLARQAANVLREGSKSEESTPLPKGLVDKTVEVVLGLRMPDEGAVKRKSP